MIMASCDLCHRNLAPVGSFLVCPTHGDRTVAAAAAPVVHVPAYGQDFRALTADAFREPRPTSGSYAEVMTPRTLRERVAAYRKWRGRDRRHDLVWWEPLGTPGSVRVMGTNAVTLVGCETYCRALLAGLLVPAALWLDPESGATAPSEQCLQKVLRVYWDEFAGLTIPEPVMSALLRASVRGGSYLLDLAHDAWQKLIDPTEPVQEAARHRDELRAVAVRAGMAGRMNHFQVSVAEAFVDYLLVARAAMEDMRRAESDSAMRRIPMKSVIAALDNDSDFEFERTLPAVISTRGAARFLGALDETKLHAYLAARPAYYKRGVFAAMESAPETGELPAALPGAAARQASATPKPAPEAGPGPRSAAPAVITDSRKNVPEKPAEKPILVSDSSGAVITLANVGRDLTARARAGELPVVVGRDAEIRLVLETLCRRTKRNPVLVGPAGAGKTAIAEGLAQRLVSGDVPEPLRGRSLIELPVASIMSTSIWVGEMERHATALIEEARSSGAILFIDELHTMVGAGSGRHNENDLSQVFKPALARGDLLVVGATTESEYQHFIEQDDALERRLNPVRVAEMSEDATLLVLAAVRDEIANSRGIQVDDAQLRDIYTLAREYMPNRVFPDKAIDLLEHAAAAAVVEGRAEMDREQVLEVIRRRIGMPLDMELKLAGLRERLEKRALLTPEVIHALLDRLSLTTRGVDLARERPNAVLLLTGKAAEQAEYVARTIAEQLYGSRDRLVRINAIVGFPELYDLHASRASRAHGLLAVRGNPWTVLLVEGIEAMTPAAAALLRGLLATGAIADHRGRQIIISDTVVVATADIGDGGAAVGFDRSGTADRLRRAAEQALGRPLAAEFDFVVCDVRSPRLTAARWIADDILPRLAERYQERGITLEWDAALVERLAEQSGAHRRGRELERYVEAALATVLSC